MLKTTRITFWGGLAVLVVGFLYEFGFVGVPYQDRTSELETRYDLHSAVARWIHLLGVAAVVSAHPIWLGGRARRRRSV